MENKSFDIGRLRRYIAAAVAAADAREVAHDRMKQARRELAVFKSHEDRIKRDMHPNRPRVGEQAALGKATAERVAVEREFQRLQRAFEAAKATSNLARRLEESCREYAEARGTRLRDDLAFVPQVCR